MSRQELGLGVILTIAFGVVTAAVMIAVGSGGESSPPSLPSGSAAANPPTTPTTAPPTSIGDITDGTRSPSTSQAAAFDGEVNRIELAPGLDLDGGTLVAVDTAGTLHVVDLATGEDRSVRASPRFDGRYGVIPVRDGVVIPSTGSTNSRTVTNLELLHHNVSALSGDGISPHADQSSVWDLTGLADDPPIVIERSVSGDPTGTAIGGFPPDSFVAPDPAGGLIVISDGATYHYSESGRRLLTDGVAFAVAADLLLVERCTARCQFVLVDRVSGSESIVRQSDDDPEILWRGALWNTSLLTTFSPNGAYANIVQVDTTSNDQMLGALDLSTGEFIPIASPAGSYDLGWTSDSTVALALDSVSYGTLTGRRIGEEARLELSNDLPTMESFLVLP